MSVDRLIGFLRVVLAASLTLCSATATAQMYSFDGVDPHLRWRTLETDHFQVHFGEQYRAQAVLAASVAERVYPRVTALLRWQPRSRTHIIMMDTADFSNGFASPLPFNYAGIWLSPPDDGELLQNRDWLELVLTHEFLHVVHMDKARGAPLLFRNVFGRTLYVPPIPFLLTPFPNVTQPGWILEGLAVYTESDKSKGYGRLGQSTFEGEMRAEVGRGLRSLREMNADGRGFPLNRDYLYGGYFFDFLRERYGEQAVQGFVEYNSGQLIGQRVQNNPLPVTGKYMDQLWVEYHTWLTARFATGAGAAEGEVLQRAFSITSPALGPSGTRWYVQSDGYTRPRLMRQAPGGAGKAVRDVESGTRLDPAADAAPVMAQYEVCRNHNILYDLYRVETSGAIQRMTRCGRYRFVAQREDGGMVAIRVLSGAAAVVLLDRDGSELRTLYQAAPGESLSGLAARGESVVVSSLQQDLWSIIEVGGEKPAVLVSDSNIKHSPRFGDSADEIYFVANYGNVYNVWSLKRSTAKLSRWTSASNGVREISAPANREILLTTIEADGDALRLYPLPAMALEERAAAAGKSVPEPAAEIAPPFTERDYSAVSSLLPRWWWPTLEIYDGAVVAGVVTSGQDALGLHRYTLAPAYEFKQNVWLGSATYVYDERIGGLLSRNLLVKSSDQTDGFPGRKITTYSVTDDAQAVAVWRHQALNQRIYWGFGGAMQDETIQFADNGGIISTHKERVVGLVAGIDTRREQFLSEGPSQGQWLKLFYETSNGLGGTYTGNVYRADWRAHLPLGKTVLAGRWMEAYAQPNAEEFSLGGSRSDDEYAYLLYALPVLNQHDFALRGYAAGEESLRGHHARLFTAEWRVPIIDVDRNFMVPPVGLNRISINVFADVGSARDSGGPDYHKGFGLELMSEPRLGYQYLGSWRLGVARGNDAGGITQVYLRLGRSF